MHSHAKVSMMLWQKKKKSFNNLKADKFKKLK